MNIIAILIFFFACCLFVLNADKKLTFLLEAKRENRFDRIPERLWSVLQLAIGQARVLSLRYIRDGGFLHALLFWAFLILLPGTLSSVVNVMLGISPLELLGSFKSIYLGIFVFFEIVVIHQVIFFLYRRIIKRPKRLTLNCAGIFCLLLILGLVVSDLISKKTLTSGIVSPWMEYTHFFIFLFFLNYLPLSKHLHVITALPSVFCRKLEPSGKLDSLDLEDESIFDEVSQADYLKNTLSWKHSLDGMSCTECGRCTDNCPANLTGKDLSPKKVVHGIREMVDGSKKPIVGNQELWNCTTCGACENACPLGVEHVQKIVGARQHSSMIEGEMPEDLAVAVDNIIDAEGQINFGNPYGMPKKDREDWMKDFIFHSNFTVLFWVGCSGAYDVRIQKITKSLAEILKEHGINFGVLGKEELCCGELIKRSGNEFSFQALVKKNIEILNRYGIKKIVTFCPHCFNTLKNEYPQFGGDFEVLHHSQLLDTLDLSEKLTGTVVYHDPCYLGRHNGIYEEPRRVLLESGKTSLIEIKNSKEDSFCCGGGGCQAFMEEESGTEKISEKRLDQLLEVNPDVIATSCPFCLTMLENALKAKGVEGVEVKDIVEI